MSPRVRLARQDDAASIAAIYRPFVETTFVTFEEQPPAADEMARRMADSPIHPWLVLESDGTIAGYVSTSPMRARHAYRWSVETGIYVDPAVQGRGFGRMLLSAHLELLERQGFVTAIVGIAIPNEPSIALHEKLGFALLGIERGVGYKLGQWVDVGRWQRDLAPRGIPAPEPRPYAETFAAYT